MTITNNGRPAACHCAQLGIYRRCVSSLCYVAVLSYRRIGSKARDLYVVAPCVHVYMPLRALIIAHGYIALCAHGAATTGNHFSNITRRPSVIDSTIRLRASYIRRFLVDTVAKSAWIHPPHTRHINHQSLRFFSKVRFLRKNHCNVLQQVFFLLLIPISLRN